MVIHMPKTRRKRPERAGSTAERILRDSRWFRSAGYVLGPVAVLGVWWTFSLEASPVILPSPMAVFDAATMLVETGLLFKSIGASTLRILSGWLLGAVVGIPLGLLIGFVRPVRLLVLPYIEGLRYVPPIAFVSIFLVWFGTGELSKTLLLFYTAVFIITINTMAGTLSLAPGRTWAARSLGASQRQVLVHVLLPQTVPHIIAGMRVALASVFITIVAVEMMAANSGIGYLIWSSRDFMLTDQVFAAILMAGLMGVTMDRLFQWAMRPISWRFQQT